MGLLQLAFSPLGRVSPRLFAPAVVAVYLAGLLSWLMLMGAVTAVAGALAFVLAQGIVTWVWFVLHAKRLRDAGRPTGLAPAVAVLYGLGVILLLLIMVLIVAGHIDETATAPPTIDLLVVMSSIGVMVRQPASFAGNVVLIPLLVLGITPVAVALLFSLWAGTRPRAATGLER